MTEVNLFFKLLKTFEEALDQIKNDKGMLKLALVNDHESYQRKFYLKFQDIILNIIGNDTNLINFYADNNALRRDTLQEAARDFLYYSKKRNNKNEK